MRIKKLDFNEKTLQPESHTSVNSLNFSEVLLHEFFSRKSQPRSGVNLEM